MARTARLEVRLEPELRARVEARAEESGQSLTVFVERALESALSDDGVPQAAGSAGRTVEGSSPGTAGSASSRTPEAVQLADGRAMHKAAMARQAKLNAAKAGKR